MRIKLCSALLAAAVAACAPAYADPPTSGWTQTFGDEFGGSSLDTTKWISAWPDHAWPGADINRRWTSWTQEYDLDDHVTVANGLCDIRTDYNPNGPDEVGGKHPNESGVISSWDFVKGSPHFSQKYGYFEASAQVNRRYGDHAGFWMVPDTEYTWPPELDVMEQYGRDPGTLWLTEHWPDPSRQDNNAYDASAYNDGTDWTAGLHTYGVYWSPTDIIWYVDGMEKKRSANRINVPMMLLFNVHTGDPSAGYIDSGTTDFSSYHTKIDWIRAWSKSDYTTTPGEEWKLPRTGWTATANRNAASASAAIDGDASTAWTNGVNVDNGVTYNDTFTVDLGAVRTFDKIVIDAGAGHGTDVLSWMTLQAAGADGTYTNIWSGPGQALQYLYFKPTQARFLRLLNQSIATGHPWTITEFQVYNDDPATRRNAAPNLLINGGFESGLTGWYTNGNGVSVSTPVHGGAKALSAPNQTYISQTVSGLTPNTTYQYTLWVRSNGANAANLFVNGHGGAEVDTVLGQSATDYRAYTLAFTTGASATSANIGFWACWDSGLWIDDATLTKR